MTGTWTDTTVPFPRWPETLKVPPTSAARSFMPSSPIDPGAVACAAVMPRPLSRIRSSTVSSVSVMVTCTELALAWHTTLFSASWTNPEQRRPLFGAEP